MPKSRFVQFILLFLVSLSLSACQKSSSEPVHPTSIETGDWTAAADTYDSELMDAAFAEADAVLGIKSLVVVQNGRLLREAYFNGNSVETPNDVRSVTKSVSSILTGLAIEDGAIKSVNEPIATFFPDQFIAEDDRRKIGMTLEHVLTMNDGFEWNEDTDIFRLFSAEDAVSFMLAFPMETDPGERFLYNTGSSNLVAPLVSEAVGKPTSEYAEQKLFNALDIKDTVWPADEMGNEYGGFGLEIKPRDMAKLGQLFLNNGTWNGEQVVPQKWVNESLKAQVDLGGDWGALQDLTYGYLWWGGQLNGYEVDFALGYGGQFITLVPELDLVIVTTSNWQVSSTRANDTELELIAIMADYILPAVE